MVKNLTANARGARFASSTPGSGRSHGGGNGNPVQYSCLENSTEKPGRYSPWDHKETDMTEHTHIWAPGDGCPRCEQVPKLPRKEDFVYPGPSRS